MSPSGTRGTHRHGVLTAQHSDLDFGRQEGEGKGRWNKEVTLRMDLNDRGNLPAKLISFCRLVAKTLRRDPKLKDCMDAKDWMPLHELLCLQGMRNITLPDLRVFVEESYSKDRKSLELRSRGLQ